MHDYHSELVLQLADFPHPEQQRVLFGAMLRLTKGRLDEDYDTGRTLLHWLAMNGSSNLLLKLVELGFDVDERESDMRTPLHLAVIWNHYSAVEMLINRCGADFHARDLNGLLPWHLALHIDWDSISDNDQRDVSKKSIIRLLALHTKESEVSSPSVALKLLQKFKQKPNAEMSFIAT